MACIILYQFRRTLRNLLRTAKKLVTYRKIVFQLKVVRGIYRTVQYTKVYKPANSFFVYENYKHQVLLESYKKETTK